MTVARGSSMDGAEDAPPPAEAPADPPAEVATPPAEPAADEAPREAPAEAGDPPDAAGVAGGAPEDPSGAPPPAPAPASTAAVHIEIVEEHFGEPGGAAAGAEPGGAAIERTATFGEGPLGLTMKRTAEEVVLVHSVQAGTQAAAQALEVGDRIVQLGDLDLRNAKVDKKFWAGAIEYVKAAPRPLALVVRPRETAAAAPPRDDPSRASRPRRGAGRSSRGALDVEKVVALDACKLAARSACGAPREGEASFDLRLGDGAVVTLAFPKPRARAWLAALGAAVVCPRAGLGPWRHGLLVGTALALARRTRRGDDGGAAGRGARGRGRPRRARRVRGDGAPRRVGPRRPRAVAALLDAGAAVAARGGAGARRSTRPASAGATARRRCSSRIRRRRASRTRATRRAGRRSAPLRTTLAPPAATLRRLQRLVGGLGCWGASLEARDGDGLTAAHALAVRRKHEALDCLLRCGVRGGRAPRAAAAAAARRPAPRRDGAPLLLRRRGRGAARGARRGDPRAATTGPRRARAACDALLATAARDGADSAGRRAPEVALDAVTAGFAPPPLPRLARSSRRRRRRRPPPRAKKAAATSATAAADLEGLKQGFAERGEKLSRLSDKAEELNNAAEEFERMCTRLNRDAQRGGRWW
ncbi:hypothetical protein JL720_11366 [Aureococcus anophagefferens]|nr:hypothetical protein JL720_11366 [Aureococcus anophagefferens]